MEPHLEEERCRKWSPNFNKKEVLNLRAQATAPTGLAEAVRDVNNLAKFGRRLRVLSTCKAWTSLGARLTLANSCFGQSYFGQLPKSA